VIGSLTEYTLSASRLGLYVGHLTLRKDEETYTSLREQIATALRELGLEHPVPERQADFLHQMAEFMNAVDKHLSEERGRMRGDTAALPMFYLGALSFRATAGLVFDGRVDEEARGVVEGALEDLGVGSDYLTILERSAGLIRVEQRDPEAERLISATAVRDAAIDFSARVLHKVIEDEHVPELAELRQMMVEIYGEIRDFRAEFRAQAIRLETLIHEHDAATMDVLRDIQAQLEASGVAPAEAEAITEGDPATFWHRVVRWFGGAGPRDAAEAALWAALDFVPGGTGVKLGIKVAEAVRKSVKAGVR
jgi:hypothetical protein